MTNEMPEVLIAPCPFCGNEAQENFATLSDYIICSCGAAGPSALNVEAAVERWNKRASPPPFRDIDAVVAEVQKPLAERGWIRYGATNVVNSEGSRFTSFEAEGAQAIEDRAKLIVEIDRLKELLRARDII